jgi:GNAT superfamily N-acetyltransferase
MLCGTLKSQKMNIRTLNTKSEVLAILPLFEAYRFFYHQKPNLEKAEAFLLEHFKNKTHVLIGAFIGDEAVGFTQLYPSYSSVSLEKLYILNDLFVDENHRSKGIGFALIKHAQQLAVKNNWKGMVLETGVDNPAQKLYEKMGWTKDTDYYHYSWKSKIEAI